MWIFVDIEVVSAKLQMMFQRCVSRRSGQNTVVSYKLPSLGQTIYGRDTVEIGGAISPKGVMR